MGSGGEMALPGVLLGADPREALRPGGGAREGSGLETCDQGLRRSAGIAVNTDGDRLDQPEHSWVAVDLDDPGCLGPVVEPVLRQRPERSEARPEREHDVRL